MCNCNNKNCHQKSALTTCNSAAQAAVAAGTILNLGTAVQDSGVSIGFNGGSNVTIDRSGLYTIEYDVTFTGTAAGTETFVVNNNGVALPCTVSSTTVAADTTYTAHGSTTLALGSCGCGAVRPTLTLVASGADVNVTFVKFRVLREA